MRPRSMRERRRPEVEEEREGKNDASCEDMRSEYNSQKDNIYGEKCIIYKPKGAADPFSTAAALVVDDPRSRAARRAAPFRTYFIKQAREAGVTPSRRLA